jgi:putative transcriptional regulator
VIGADLAPGLLIAMPQLVDPNFTRSVVLMIEHTDEGSLGLVINQPHPILASHLLDDLSMPWGGDPDAVVWSGGPVQRNTGWVLYEPPPGFDEDDDAGTIRIVPGIELSRSPQRLRALAAKPPSRLRLLLGYSGWGPGQLAREMAHGSWLHADLDADIVFDPDADAMWTAAVRSIGINPDAVVQGRGVH